MMSKRPQTLIARLAPDDSIIDGDPALTPLSPAFTRLAPGSLRLFQLWRATRLLHDFCFLNPTLAHTILSQKTSFILQTRSFVEDRDFGGSRACLACARLHLLLGELLDVSC